MELYAMFLAVIVLTKKFNSAIRPFRFIHPGSFSIFKFRKGFNTSIGIKTQLPQ